MGIPRRRPSGSAFRHELRFQTRISVNTSQRLSGDIISRSWALLDSSASDFAAFVPIIRHEDHGSELCMQF